MINTTTRMNLCRLQCKIGFRQALCGIYSYRRCENLSICIANVVCQEQCERFIYVEKSYVWQQREFRSIASINSNSVSYALQSKTDCQQLDGFMRANIRKCAKTYDIDKNVTWHFVCGVVLSFLYHSVYVLTWGLEHIDICCISVSCCVYFDCVAIMMTHFSIRLFCVWCVSCAHATFVSMSE